MVETSEKTEIFRVRAEVTDLWRDECGWSANCSWVRRVTLTFPQSASELQVSRAIKKALGIEGMRKDDWAGSDWCWRDGCVGAYADVVY